jgi:ABC-type nitrate/sulfonate/bicarbonate transport system substrate-binding protein
LAAPQEGSIDALTRRRFVGRSAGTFAAVGGASMLLAACGDDDSGSSGSSEGSSTNAGATKNATIVNILPPQVGYVAEYIADIDGYFKKAGVNVKVETARGSAPAIQAVLSSTALLTRCGRLESLIAIADRGAPIECVAFTTHKSPLAIVSDKKAPLNSPADLKGKRIGIPSEGGTSETTLDLLLSSNNIPLKDVPRQVTGFTPGTFELIRKGRIAGFIIGATQIQQFKEAVPDANFLETAKYVSDGENYITSKKGLAENKDAITAYLTALKGAMQQVIADKDNKYADTIKKLKSKYDFQELKSDTVSAAWIDFLVGSWLLKGEDQLLKTNPDEWNETYDAAVKIKAAKGGVDVTKNLSESLV